ncbi:PDGLE domain-containing protein [Janibacter massiliensis]|uniref:PDGLE domain-containing protein n=1 Tax=Janibacter massiliensis TaxID=2058291 RepID=UPI000D10751D|nr:PDGLE domain-containing protein [Janibacter massiliensis]
MTGRRVSTRTFVLVGFALSALVAGVLSLWASSHPDGLEYVAERTGFGGTATGSPTAGSPLADYGLRGLDGPLGTSIAGLVGIVVVGVLMTVLARALARRG